VERKENRAGRIEKARIEGHGRDSGGLGGGSEYRQGRGQ
jgi:hypothetical protein